MIEVLLQSLQMQIQNRKAIGAESKVMERTCRGTKTDGDGEEER